MRGLKMDSTYSLEFPDGTSTRSFLGSAPLVGEIVRFTRCNDKGIKNGVYRVVRRE